MTSSPLNTMTSKFPTALWNDSADPKELSESISYGAVGATCNPVIAVTCIKADMPRWTARIAELAEQLPEATEAELGWKIVEEVSLEAAKLLDEAFHEHKGINGRLSMQTDPRLARSKDKLVEQACYFDSLAPNIIGKIPATKVGIEAIERGLMRREAEGMDVSAMGPVVTIMVGRLDDWLKDRYAKDKLCFDPGYLEWAGVAAFKRAYAEFNARGLRARLLAAAYRNALQWTQLIGGKAVLSPPFAWQKRFQASGITPEHTIDTPVDRKIMEALQTMPEFRKSYEPDGMTPAEFDQYGATRKTLRQFLAADEELDQIVRDVLVPAP